MANNEGSAEATVSARHGRPLLQTLSALLETRRYYLFYTALFAVAAIAAFALLIGNGLSFVWSTDGATQHLPTLVYLRDWVVATLQSALQGNFAASTWDMNIGLGSDMLTSLGFYAFGDVFNLLALVVPREHIGIAFTGIAILRLYLSGISFSAFARRFRMRGYAVLLAALLYALSGFSLFMVLRHPHFIDPLIYLPLICLGAEKILHAESPVLFIVSFWLMFCAHFYFSYMVCIFAVAYVVCRLCMTGGRSAKDILMLALKFIGCGIVAACLASPLLLPNVFAVMDSSRTETGGYVPLLYGSSYYLELLPTLSTVGFTGSQCYIGVTQLGVLAMIFLFLQRGRHALVLKIACIVLIVSILVPWIGHAMNGFFYVANRHSFGLVFFACGLVAWLLPQLLSASGTQLRALAIAGAVYAVCIAISAASCISNGTADMNFGQQGALLYAGRGALVIVAVVVTLIAIRAAMRHPAKSAAIKATACALTAAFVMVNGFATSFVYRNLMLSFDDVHTVMTDDPFGEAGMGDTPQNGSPQDAVYRYDSGSLPWDDSFFAAPVTRANSGMIDGRPYDTQYFTLTPWSESDFLSGEMELGGYALSGHHYWDLDSRASILDLLSVRYWAGSPDAVPYGFSETSASGQAQRDDGTVFAENPHAVPFGFTYNSVIDRADYEALGTVDKQEALMRAALVEDADDAAYAGLARQNGENWAREMEISATTKGAVQFAADGSGPLLISNEGARPAITLNFDAVSGVELYVELIGFAPEYGAGGNVTAYAQSGDDAAWCRFVPPGAQAYSAYNSGLLYLGYSDQKRSKIELSLRNPYDYEFSGVRVWALSLDNHADLADALAAESLHNVTFGTNSITGSISTSRPALLCLSIPYSTGWSASVDSQPAEIMRTNTWMCGIMLAPGNHSIELHYESPGLHVGMILFGCGLAALVVLIIVTRRRRASRR